VALAIKLCDAGFDCWEDVDQYVRNELVEQQLLQAGFLEATSEAGPERPVNHPQETDDQVIERNIGAFAHYGDDPAKLLLTGLGSASCCLQAGTQGLYYAWEGIVREKDGTVQINLLLNRASPWLDVDSYLPHEGKVVVRNKTARQLLLRVPRWADKGAVQCHVNEEVVSQTWLGNYVIFNQLNPQDTVRVQFPMVEEKATYTSQGRNSPQPTDYTLYLKGNDLVDIALRADATGYPIYLRDHYRKDRAILTETERYVSRVTLGSL
jgi:hypothetical protein